MLWQGCITYVAGQEDVEHVCRSILASQVEALGFDVEWHVTYRHASALSTIPGAANEGLAKMR